MTTRKGAGDFDLVTGSQLRAAYGNLLDELSPISLDPSRVPARLRHLIPLAELFGQEDDLIRERLVEKSPPELLESLRRQVTASEAGLDAWLAGPEAESADPSDEYVAFSAMRMAVDYLNA